MVVARQLLQGSLLQRQGKFGSGFISVFQAGKGYCTEYNLWRVISLGAQTESVYSKKKGAFWDFKPRGSSKKRRFGGT
jgi:hypothetical protein